MLDTRKWGWGMQRVFWAGLFVLSLSGCVAKTVVPMAMAQVGDDQLSCADLKRQIAANEAEVKGWMRDDKSVENGNVAKGVATAIPVAGIFFAASMDLSNEEQIKARAILDRNEQLYFISKQKRCES